MEYVPGESSHGQKTDLLSSPTSVVLHRVLQSIWKGHIAPLDKAVAAINREQGTQIERQQIEGPLADFVELMVLHLAAVSEVGPAEFAAQDLSLRRRITDGHPRLRSLEQEAEDLSRVTWEKLTALEEMQRRLKSIRVQKQTLQRRIQDFTQTDQLVQSRLGALERREQQVQKQWAALAERQPVTLGGAQTLALALAQAAAEDLPPPLPKQELFKQEPQTDDSPLPQTLDQRLEEARRRGYLVTFLSREWEIANAWKQWCEQQKLPCLQFHEHRHGYGTILIDYSHYAFLSAADAEKIAQFALEEGVFRTPPRPSSQMKSMKEGLQTGGRSLHYVHVEQKSCTEEALAFLERVVQLLRTWGFLAQVEQPKAAPSPPFLPGELAWASQVLPAESLQGLVTILEAQPDTMFRVKWYLSQQEITLPSSALQKLSLEQQAYWMAVVKNYQKHA